MNHDVRIWYFVGMIADRVVHVDHDVYDNGKVGRDKANVFAKKMFDRGVNVDGEMLRFSRVIALSESHETALDISQHDLSL